MIDDNLLKYSLRMKSELSQPSRQKKSLMQLLAFNDDFVFPIESKETVSDRFCRSKTLSATSKLIDEERQQSILKKQAEVRQNIKLRHCDKFEAASKKREYKKWDFTHAQLAGYHLKPMIRRASYLWPKSAETGKCSNNENESLKELDSAVSVHAGLPPSSKVGHQSPNRKLDSQDGEEAIPENERVQMTLEKIRKETSNGVLAEIHQIKERHRQLEALTQTKKRAVTDAAKPQASQKDEETKMDKDALRKILLADANLQRDLEFNAFKEKTTVKLQRNFNSPSAVEGYPGIVWKPKWNPSANQLKGRICKSTHPVCDAANKDPQLKFAPAKQGDLPPCIFLPIHIQAKTPMESAILLDQFIKQTRKAETSA
ncbi:uncharacterized protein [Watersipora subatra]|uniref:uncharacterized protein n=1 Tax=Watersipora subatra TaxID=2589382 RepID=UPI00355C1B45